MVQYCVDPSLCSGWRVFRLEKQSFGYNSTHCISEKVVLDRDPIVAQLSKLAF